MSCFVDTLGGLACRFLNRNGRVNWEVQREERREGKLWLRCEIINLN